MRTRKVVLAVLFLLAGAACATIVGETTQLIPLNSAPDGAEIEISDETGMAVYKGRTPATVTLQKSDGSYFGGKTYSIKFTKEGFNAQVATIKAEPNAWYLAGNLLFGGLIGWFIVDPLTGAMYTLTPKQVSSALGEKTASAAPGAITVMLVKEVPPVLRDQMRRVN